jgi:hypothetical protein
MFNPAFHKTLCISDHCIISKMIVSVIPGISDEVVKILHLAL